MFVFPQCQFCPKTFVNRSFLLSHLRRRHQKEEEGEEGKSQGRRKKKPNYFSPDEEEEEDEEDEADEDGENWVRKRSRRMEMETLSFSLSF